MDKDAFTVKWYGINALEFRHQHGLFMIDPYVSRDYTRITVASEVDKYITEKPDFVLMTHAHWDHLPDMPRIIERTGTTLYASKTACNIMRSLGVPENHLHELFYGETLHLPGGITVVALESRHMGTLPEDNFYAEPQDPTTFKRCENWRGGEVFAFLFEIGGRKILNCGSANLHKPAMHGIDCDYFFCGISRWKEGFPELLTENIRFKTLIPTHHDEFTLPLSEFRLRGDMERLKQALPGIHYRELAALTPTNFC